MPRSLAPCVLVYFLLLQKIFWSGKFIKNRNFVSYSSNHCEVQDGDDISGESLVMAEDRRGENVQARTEKRNVGEGKRV